MDVQDAFPAFDIRQTNRNRAVEPARAQKRWIENIRSVGGSQDDQLVMHVKSIHFHQQLVQGLFTFIIDCAQPGSTAAADGIHFIDEDNRRSYLHSLSEKITYPAGAYTDKHFHEFGSADTEERDSRFSGNGSGEQGLAGSWRSNQQHTVRNASAQIMVFFRVAQKIDNFSQFLFGFICAGYIFERHCRMIACILAGFATAETEYARLAARSTSPQPDHSAQKEQQGQAI